MFHGRRSLLIRLQSRWEEWQDARIDRRYGLDTEGYIPMTVRQRERFEGACDYEPVTPRVFHAIVKAAAIRPQEFCFVDYGCGKGRALVLAAEMQFRRVIGIELLPALHDRALVNLRAYRVRRPDAPPMEVLLGDATSYVPPPQDALLYFYNPFSAPLLRRAMAVIERSCRLAPRRLFIAYRNPVHAHVLDEAPFLRRLAHNRSFALYAFSRISAPIP
jgi:SAM-dependent methyltransferase